MTTLADTARTPGVTAWVTGPDADAGRREAAALLRDLGRPVALSEDDDPEVSARLAEAGVVVLTGGSDAGPTRERHDLVGARFVELALDEPPPHDAPPRGRARRVVDAVDHALEVASRPIFVVGMGRSGTTWTLDVLASHPRVAGLFETLVFAPERLGHLRPGALDADRGIPVFGWPEGPGQIVDRATALRAARATGAGWLATAVRPHHDWLVEKTPAHAQVAEVIAEVLPDARFIHVVRDVRDALVSIDAAQSTFGRQKARARVGPHVLLRKPLAWRIGLEWVSTTEKMREASRAAPVHEIRYERMRAEPVATCLELFAFCGIPCDEQLARRIAAENDFSRLPHTGEGRFRRAGRVGDWRHSLSPISRALVMAAAGSALTEKGYLRRPGLAYHAVQAARRALRRTRRR